jgi:hypothetical protein
VALVPSGPYANGVVVCYDTDHDGEGELIFSYDDWSGYQYWNTLEYRPYNRYEVVQSDTAPLEWTPGVISTGRFWPYDAGDVDRDGKTDLTGQLFYMDSLDTMRTVVCTMESPDSLSYPDSLTWFHALFPSSYSLIPCAYADLDRDDATEILMPYGRTMVFENVGDNRESLVYNSLPSTTERYPVADFDGNGRTDYACNWDAKVRICECVGDNQYAQVCSLDVSLINARDIFAGNDVDQNGRPEFFMVDARYGGSGWKLLLYMFEATAEHEYAFWLVDSEPLGMGVDPAPKVSLCADLDGDGVEEIIWSCCTHGYILKATGPHQFRREFLWLNNNGPSSLCNAADFNGNGYNELFVGGSGKISVFEVEPVRVMYPYHREVLVAGDTCLIRWRIYTPPRCDSVSLFLKTDTTIYPGERFWRLDTMGKGARHSVWPRLAVRRVRLRLQHRPVRRRRPAARRRPRLGLFGQPEPCGRSSDRALGRAAQSLSPRVLVRSRWTHREGTDVRRGRPGTVRSRGPHFNRTVARRLFLHAGQRCEENQSEARSDRITPLTSDHKAARAVAGSLLWCRRAARGRGRFDGP